MIAHSRAETLLSRVIDALNQVRGAFSVVLLTDEGLIAAKDPHGLRPLCLGRLRDSYIVASETCAFDLIGAEYVREVEPGELIALVGSSGLLEIARNGGSARDVLGAGCGLVIAWKIRSRS